MYPTDLTDLALGSRCPYCFVPAGDWCKTFSGARADYLHQLRTYPINQAYGIGYLEGYEDGRR